MAGQGRPHRRAGVVIAQQRLGRHGVDRVRRADVDHVQSRLGHAEAAHHHLDRVVAVDVPPEFACAGRGPVSVPLDPCELLFAGRDPVQPQGHHRHRRGPDERGRGHLVDLFGQSIGVGRQQLVVLGDGREPGRPRDRREGEPIRRHARREDHPGQSQRPGGLQHVVGGQPVVGEDDLGGSGRRARHRGQVDDRTGAAQRLEGGAGIGQLDRDRSGRRVGALRLILDHRPHRNTVGHEAGHDPRAQVAGRAGDHHGAGSVLEIHLHAASLAERSRSRRAQVRGVVDARPWHPGGHPATPD